MPPVTSERVGTRVDAELPAAGFVVETVVEPPNGHSLGRPGGGVRRGGHAQPVEVQMPQRSPGMNPK